MSLKSMIYPAVKRKKVVDILEGTAEKCLSVSIKSVFRLSTSSRAHKKSSNGINDLLGFLESQEQVIVIWLNIYHKWSALRPSMTIVIVKRPFDYCNEKECINLVIDVKVISTNLISKTQWHYGHNSQLVKIL